MVEVEVRFKFPDLYCTSAFIYLVHANVGEFINNFRIFISLAEIRSRKLNFLPHRDSIPLLHKYFVLRKEKIVLLNGLQCCILLKKFCSL